MMNELCLLCAKFHHVPYFISDLNSSRDLPKLNLEFHAKVSPIKYLVSAKAIFSLITKLDSMSNLIKEGILT